MEERGLNRAAGELGHFKLFSTILHLLGQSSSQSQCSQLGLVGLSSAPEATLAHLCLSWGPRPSSTDLHPHGLPQAQLFFLAPPLCTLSPLACPSPTPYFPPEPKGPPLPLALCSLPPHHFHQDPFSLVPATCLSFFLVSTATPAFSILENRGVCRREENRWDLWTEETLC